ncbi:carboxymuconolactone decarboxylase family protein [Streptomyces iconiensis]|uniref:Carboxymuconolactone decarboxylase family protein n=1 Tax=Streptomyces iconiensis TaxID=1384038 RepID=A0ABT6ZW27_9ACTN|nr:carboxymuconolactone decarboxylase family protein [Streptomyces iconiensis]MDJ1132999.1 carboxymuconolactone decarboxylase family protein [Streptomyces iconiensis]
MTDHAPSQDARYELGVRTMYQLGGQTVTDEFLEALSGVCPALGEHIVSTIYGELYQRPELSPAERGLTTLVVLATLGDCEREIRLHAKVALNAGLSPARIIETMFQIAPYAGVPRALNAVLVLREIFNEMNLLPVVADRGRPAS